MRHKSSNLKTFKALLFIVLLLISFTSLYPRTYHIKQDGTGNFTTITAGINAVQNGDTLLVYPGRYFENIELIGKDITLTSLYGVTSDDQSIIGETIIDGNQQGTVVNLRYNTRQTVINGFTVTNGSGLDHGSGKDSYGGGMHISRSSATISNCIVEHNYAYYAGAIFHSWVPHIESYPFLQGNIIRYNRAIWTNGGVSGSRMQFCNNIPNSIYHNYSGVGTTDLITGELRQRVLVLDTFTVPAEVAQSGENYFFWNTGWNYEEQPDNFVFIVLNSKIEPVAADLYVSPDGCNSNSGLSFDEPLQTIAFAMAKIDPDSVNRLNIFLDEGIYSHSLNNQVFSARIRSNVNIIGQGKEQTILDMEYDGWAFSAYEADFSNSANEQIYVSNFSIRNLSIINGGQNPEKKYFQMHTGIMITSGREYEIENIGIYNGNSGNGILSSALYSWGNHYSFALRDIDIYNMRGSIGLYITINGVDLEDDIHLVAENIRVRKSHPSPEPQPDIALTGISARIDRWSTDKPFYADLSNIEITDSELTQSYKGNVISSFIYRDFTEYYPGKLRLINTTIGNNTGPNGLIGGGIHLEGHVEVDIVNSIIYGNLPDNLVLSGNRWNYPMMISIQNSLLEGGAAGVRFTYNPNADVRWGEGVISIEPGWVGEDVNPDYPYMLSENSSARGAGTLDIPDFEFPEYDLAGNPRIVDGQIDMGAYQYQVPTEVRESDLETKGLRGGDFNLRNFPNPAVTLLNHSTIGVEGHRSSTTGTNIAFEAPDAGNVMIEIYNLKGQFVKRVFDAYIPEGEHNVFWDGRDERGRYVATGFYMYNLHFNEQVVATGRATFIK